MQGQASLVFNVICTVYLTAASPQYYSLPYPGQPFQGSEDPYYNNHPWQPNVQSNLTKSKPNTAPYYYPRPNPQLYPNPNPQAYPNPNPQAYPNPNPQAYPNPQTYPDPMSSEDIHRQYGVPPHPSASGYPQIYKIDNLIIIANPPQQQPQPCIPQPMPPPYPRPPTEGDVDKKKDEILNRMPGDEPSKCTWAIVACCSPDNVQVRYNCFELLGCPGFFFDNSPCEPKIVMAAANAALEFYRSTGNTTTTSGSSDTISNRL